MYMYVYCVYCIYVGKESSVLSLELLSQLSDSVMGAIINPDILVHAASAGDVNMVRSYLSKCPHQVILTAF